MLNLSPALSFKTSIFHKTEGTQMLSTNMNTLLDTSGGHISDMYQDTSKNSAENVFLCNKPDHLIKTSNIPVKAQVKENIIQL